MIEVVEVFETP